MTRRAPNDAVDGCAWLLSQAHVVTAPHIGSKPAATHTPRGWQHLREHDLVTQSAASLGHDGGNRQGHDGFTVIAPRSRPFRTRAEPSYICRIASSLDPISSSQASSISCSVGGLFISTRSRSCAGLSPS